MSVSAVAPTPFYQDPERLPIGLPQAQVSNDGKSGDAAATDGNGDHLRMFAAEDNSPSFWDLLDVINPLQHIPVVSNIYREITGDQIGVGARLVGGTLFGGPIGLIASAVDCVVEESTGKDAGGHVLALFRDEGTSGPETQPASQFAQAAAAQPSPPTPSAAAEAVSSSPAKVAAEGPQGGTGAPVITLPEGSGGGASQPMVFTADGLQAAAPATANPAPVQLANATPTSAQLAAAQAAARYQSSSKGFMPVPPRAAPGEAKPVPQITVPVSNGMQRSNVPVTGRSPISGMPVTPAARPPVAREALAAPADANGQTAAGPDWFTSAWSQALDKYERANQRNGKAATGTTSTSTLQ